MHIENLIDTHKLIHKLLSINKILTSIKGHNSIKNRPKITCIRYNMDLVFINAYTKFYKNSSFVLKIWRKNTFLYQSRAITMLFINKFSPFAIPNHSQISVSMQSLKKIGQKLLKLRVRKRSADGRTDWRTLKIFRGYNIIVKSEINFQIPKIELGYNYLPHGTEVPNRWCGMTTLYRKLVFRQNRPIVFLLLFFS